MRLLAAAMLVFGLTTASSGAVGAGTFTAEDVRVMALNMYHEARGEGALGMRAVGWVVLNRMAEKAFPDSIEGVVYQGCQFSWVCDGVSDAPRDTSAWRRALQIAAELLARPVADPTRGAMWYHASWVRSPGFGNRVAQVARIGRHVFYSLVKRPEPRPEPLPVMGPRLLFASR